LTDRTGEYRDGSSRNRENVEKRVAQARIALV